MSYTEDLEAVRRMDLNAVEKNNTEGKREFLRALAKALDVPIRV